MATYAEKSRKAELVSFMKKVVSAYPGSDRYRASLGKALFENRDCLGARAIFEELPPLPPRASRI